MPISDIANIVISLQTAQALAAGFGVPMIFSAHTKNTDRIRFYSSVAGLVGDTFATTDPEYQMASAMFAQNPAPAKIAVGRRVNRPTMRWAVTPVAVNLGVYQMKVNGTLVTFTADGTATVTEVIAGLKTAIDALALGITVSDQTTYMRILATTVGAYFTVEVLDTTLLGIAQDGTDAGAAADLDAISLVDSTWYALVTPYKSFAENQAIATWTESHEKLFMCETQDSAVITTVLAGGTDIATVLKGQSLMRSPVLYHQGDGTQAGSAWLGKCLPLDPGSETWKFKTLAGVTPTGLTDTHLTNLRAKNANFYYVVSGISMTAEGSVPGTEWIDTIRGRDWLKANMGARIITRLANAKKVPYTDAGAVILEAEVRGALQEAEDVGFLRADPKYTVTVPPVSSQSTANRGARYFPNLNFAAQLAGAVHKVGVSGVVTN